MLRTPSAATQGHANTRALTIMPTYVASGTPNMLTNDMHIDYTLAWSQAGHVIVRDSDDLGKCGGLEEAIASLASAGAVVHVVSGGVA